MKIIYCIVTGCVLLSGMFFKLFQSEGDDSICIELNYYFQLKEKTAGTYWKDFNSRKLYGPMMYYGKGGTYVVGPNTELLKKISFKPMAFCINGLVVGKVADTADSNRLNMQVDYDEEDSSLMCYKNAIASVSDSYITKKHVANFTNTEFWDAMVLHESFHLFQTSYPKFKACQNETQALFQRDTLLSFYTQLNWYKESIESENQLLLNAISCDGKDSVTYYIIKYLQTKKLRQKKIVTTYKIDIAPLEDMLERSEGIARYMEYCMKRIVKEMPRQQALEKTDTGYHYGAYANYERKSDDVMNGLGRQYYYATGLNLAILFEKLKIDYQQTIYKDNRSFDWYLKKIK